MKAMIKKVLDFQRPFYKRKLIDISPIEYLSELTKTALAFKGNIACIKVMHSQTINKQFKFNCPTICQQTYKKC